MGDVCSLPRRLPPFPQGQPSDPGGIRCRGGSQSTTRLSEINQRARSHCQPDSLPGCRHFRCNCYATIVQILARPGKDLSQRQREMLECLGVRYSGWRLPTTPPPLTGKCHVPRSEVEMTNHDDQARAAEQLVLARLLRDRIDRVRDFVLGTRCKRPGSAGNVKRDRPIPGIHLRLRILGRFCPSEPRLSGDCGVDWEELVPCSSSRSANCCC